MARKLFRWLPAVVVPAVIAAAALTGSIQASAASQLPIKSPAELLAFAAQNTVQQFSGTVEQASQLGLPQLPTAGPSASTPTGLDLLSGSHTARIFVDGPQHLRLQLLDPLAERDVVRNGDHVWAYNSKDSSASQWTMPARSATPPLPAAPHSMNPADLAQKFLAAVDPGTAVTIGPQTQVAGRSAYQLVLTPNSAGTLIGSVTLAVDGDTGMPLGVDVRARGSQDPAIHVAFNQLTLSAPAADLFAFTPPAGTTVQQQSLPAPGAHPSGQTPAKPGAVTGSGWESVLQLEAGTVPTDALASPLLSQALTAVPGGRLLSTTLLNIYFADDGRVFAGAVPAAALQDAAAAK